MKRTRITIARASTWLLVVFLSTLHSVFGAVEDDVVYGSILEATQAARLQLSKEYALPDQLQDVASVDEVTERFAGFFRSTAGNVAGAERQLLELADQLGRGDPDDNSSRLVLQWLAVYRSRTLIPHPEGRGQDFTAAFPIASRAQGALNQLAFRRQFRSAKASLRAGHKPHGVHGFKELSRPAQEGLLKALYDAPAQQIRALANQLKHPAPQAVAVALARRLSDVAWYNRALSGGDTALHFELMRDIESLLSASQIMPILDKALTTKAAGAAVTAMGRIAGNPAARARLMSLLGDAAVGDAAALALSKSHDPELLDGLEKVVRSADTQRQRGNALLALKLNGSEVAQSMLSAYVRRTPSDDQQAQMVKTWQR